VDFIELFLSGATFRVLNVGDRATLIDLLAAVGQARLRPVIDSTYVFENAVDGYRRASSGAAIGKVVVSL
jgi:alcohol dehydrogenase